MSKFGKFLTFVVVSGAAVAGFKYFMDQTQNCECPCDGEGEEGAKPAERSYVSLNPEKVEEIKEKVNEGADTLKKAVKSAAQDIMAKAEDAAKGVGLVKENTKASDFEFKAFEDAAEEVADAAEEVADAAEEVAEDIADEASKINIE